jgi:hypothetical protein
MPRPDLSRIPEWYHRYVNRVPGNELIPSLYAQLLDFPEFLKTIPKVKYDYSYAPGKWTIKEMLQHILDAERIFAYRGLCIARQEKAPLPGFNEDEYALNSKAVNRKWEDLCKEFILVRESNCILFSSFDGEQLNQTGIASEKSIYVLGIGFIMIGHIAHHQNILLERYL